MKQPCFLSQLSSSLEERREIKDSANLIIDLNLLLKRRKIALKYDLMGSIRSGT